MVCKIFLETFKTLNMSLSRVEEQQFCDWLKERVDGGKQVTIPSLLGRSPVSSKLSDIHKIKEWDLIALLEKVIEEFNFELSSSGAPLPSS